MASAGRHRRVITATIGIVFGMFCFGFALVPIYDVFCEITGINGKLSGTAVSASDYVGEASGRSPVKVQFITQVNENMPWVFEPVTRQVEVLPGQEQTVLFLARNITNRDMVAQAVPSVAPSESATFFVKTECFCFEQQALKGGAETEMPVRFVVDRALPEHIRTITLSYTLFDISDKVEKTKT